MDNGAADGGVVSVKELMEAANRVGAQEVVIPDEQQNSQVTLQLAHDSLEHMVDRGFRLMAVPQGTGLETWAYCYQELKKLPIHTVGIPKNLRNLRASVISWLSNEESPDDTPDLQFHLLGTWGNPIHELRPLPSLYKWIRGIDTKLPVRAGQQGVALHKDKGLLIGRADLSALDFDHSDDPFPIITDNNCRVFKTWAKGGERGTKGAKRDSNVVSFPNQH